MRTRAGIVLQARMASTRLPGKALQTIGAYTLLEHCLRRLIAAGVAHVVLATTRSEEDDVLADIAAGLGVPVCRGSTDDVLARLAEAAQTFGLDPIIRATGDNPAVDIQGPGRLLAALRSGAADYAVEDGLPCGTAVEAFTLDGLLRSASDARDTADREHVTTWMKRNPQAFTLLFVPAPAPLRRPDLRLTVDTADDLAHMRTLFARTGMDEPSLRQIIEAAGRPRCEVA